MLVVHFMCSAYGSEVPIIRVAEPLRALMDENIAVSYTHLRAHETVLDLVCRLLLEKKKTREPQK